MNQRTEAERALLTLPSDPGISRKLDQIVSFCSVLAIAFGVWVLAGWALHIPIVKSILAGQVAVKANTAFCFVLIGCALWLLKKEPSQAFSGWTLVGRVAAVIATIVGLLSLLEFVFRWNLGIDQVLFIAGPEDIRGSVRPGLMSPVAAFGFFTLGCGLLLMDARTRLGRWSSRLLPVGAAIASMFGILDFVLDANITHTYISPMTASVLFLFSFGLMFARTQSGVGALVARAGPGGTLMRRLLPAAIVVPLLVSWLRWKGEFAGLYSEWAGTTMMTMFTVVVLASLTAWTGLVVDRSDAARRRGEETISRLAAIVTSSSDGIIGKTIDGTVTSWNPGAEAIYGYPAQEIIGRSIFMVIPPDHRGEFATILERVKQGQRSTITKRYGRARTDIESTFLSR